MDVPVLPDPVEQPAAPHDLPGLRPRPTLAVIGGGGETTDARGELRSVPASGDDDRDRRPLA